MTANRNHIFFVENAKQVFAAAASRLVDRTICGGNALLLVAGTPGSGRSHTLWGTLPTQRENAGVSPAAAAATTEAGKEEQGLVPQALTDLVRRWRCGNGSPFYHSSAAAATGARFSSCAAASSSPSRPPFSLPFAFRLCAAELFPGGVATGNDDDGDGTPSSSTTTRTRDLLHRGSLVVSCHTDPGNVRGRKESLSSSRSPRRWALSARDALAGLASSPSPSPSPPRSSVGENIGGGFRSRGSVGRGGTTAADGALLTSRVLAGVTDVCAEGVDEALALVRKVGQ